MPAMAVVCQKDSAGERTDGSWRFHYAGWNLDDTLPPEFKDRHNEFCREHATSDDPFPEERKGCLDKEVLSRLGLTEKRTKELDALFFHDNEFPRGYQMICIFILVALNLVQLSWNHQDSSLEHLFGPIFC